MSRIKLCIYGHGGSQNHGNEAIVRGIRELFPDAELFLYSFYPEVDCEFGLDKTCVVKSMVSSYRKYSFWNIARAVSERVGNALSVSENNVAYYAYFQPFLSSINSDTIYLLEAGDQYCEPGPHRSWYAYLNREIQRRGAKTVLLGCSINGELFEDEAMIFDLKRYTKIIARESLTYNKLKEKNIENVFLAPDPAFAMRRFEGLIDFPGGGNS